MKTIKLFALLLALGLGALSDAAERPVVAVPLFSNKTAGNVTHGNDGGGMVGVSTSASRHPEYTSGEWKLPDVAREVATDACTDALAATHEFRILARTTPSLEMIDCENLFHGGGGAPEAAVAFQALMQTNAQYLLIGRINRFRVDETRGESYGVRRWQVVTSISMDLQLINVKSQEIVAGREMSKRSVVNIPEGVTSTSGMYDWEKVLREAVKLAVPEFIDYAKKGMTLESSPSAAEQVEVNVTSTPAGADVEFDGVFYGNTPCRILLPAKMGVLTISAGGYEPWQKRLVPNGKMNIAPVLKKRPDATNRG